jgi:CRP/FNR family transcriptional regulator, dissimilatory nitrate respiration regulator
MLQSYNFKRKKMEIGLLLNAPLFNGLNINEISSILAETKHRIKSYQAGSLIAQSGEPVERMIIVIRGIVKGEMVDYAGRIIKIEDIPAPGAIASAFIFGKRNLFPVNVIAVSDTELLTIEREDFLKLMMTNDRILINFLNMISNRSQFLSEKIKFLNFKTIKGKLAHLIIQKAGPGMSVVRLDMTQNDLADFFGVARPSVARALGELEDEGYIVADNKNIRILDKDGLSLLTVD